MIKSAKRLNNENLKNLYSINHPIINEFHLTQN